MILLKGKCVFTSSFETVVDGLKYTSIDDTLRTARVGDGSSNEGNSGALRRTTDVFIESHVIMNSVLYEVIEVGQYSFTRCQKIPFVFVPNTIKVLRYRAFMYCYGLKTIILPFSITTIEYQALFALDLGALTNFTFCGASDSGITLGSEALSSGIKEVFAPSTYKKQDWKLKPLGTTKSDTWCSFYFYMPHMKKPSCPIECRYTQHNCFGIGIKFQFLFFFH